MDKQLDVTKRIKLYEIALHFHFQDNSIDYLLLLSSKCELTLYCFSNAYFDILSNYTVYVKNPLHFTKGSREEIYLLHEVGIYTWSLTQIASQCQPQKTAIDFPLPPLLMFSLSNNQFAVVLQQNTIMMVSAQSSASTQAPLQLCLSKLRIDTTSGVERSLFVLIPSKRNYFPYLFSQEEISLWSKTQFFDYYIKQCRDYYLEDEVLPQREQVILYSASQQMVYVLLQEELFILHAKPGSEEVGMVLSMRMRVRTSWGEGMLSGYLGKSGQVLYVGVDRVGQVVPFEYRPIRKSIKQKGGSVINFAYCIANNMLLLISHHGPSALCKIYLHKAEES